MDDHLQEAVDDGVVVVVGGGGGVLFRRRRKTRGYWRKTFGEGKLMVTPTNRQDEYSAICLFEGWKIEGRDLQ